MDHEGFNRAIDTLKLYRRAELLDEDGKKLIDDLYVDPLPNDQVLRTILKPNTTFLIGRKGTGKSTIFQKAQSSLNQNEKTTWAYIDIKTLFESSTSQLISFDIAQIDNALNPEAIKKLLIFKNFFIELVKEIRKQFSERIEGSLWTRIKDAFSGTKDELFFLLDEFLAELESEEFLNVTAREQKDLSSTTNTTKTKKAGGGFNITNTGISISALAELIDEISKSKSSNYSQIFLRIFNIRSLVQRLEDILKSLGLRYLYIFIDDFSELSSNDVEEVVDSILTPFNNWSNEFIKLKVAVYPGRIYYGNIDPTKIDEVFLDIYRAYGRADVTLMEESAITFTSKLIQRRLDLFCDDDANVLFDFENDEFKRVLFYASMGNPRILGYLLYFCFETATIYNKKIGISVLQDASRRYFEEKIFQYFRLNKFLYESYEERSSIFSLKELYEQIVSRAKDLRTYRESQVMKEIKGRPPTSHFHVLSMYDQVLSTLELNFLITKYYEMKDRDGREVSVYALNHGLCQLQAINFGRPREKREHRLYFVERIFDYSGIIASYLRINQEIVCDSCGSKHDQNDLDKIEAYDMLCPTCRAGTCKIINLSRKYENLVRSVSQDLLLPQTELGILKTLHDSRQEMFAKDIAGELDCSYQLIGKRGKNLSDRDLLTRDENEQGRRVFIINEKAEKVYFIEEDDDKLNVDD